MINLNYILLHNLENNIKEQLIKNYRNDGYQVIFEDQDNIIIKKGNHKLIDEDKYIKITLSTIKRNRLIKKSNGKIIDLTEAFEYAQEKGKYNMFHNKFDWYIRNIITKETIN